MSPNSNDHPSPDGLRSGQWRMKPWLTQAIYGRYLDAVKDLENGRYLMLDDGRVILTTGEKTARYAPDVEGLVEILLDHKFARAIPTDADLMVEGRQISALLLVLTERGADFIARLAVQIRT